MSHVSQTAPLRRPVRWPATLAAMLLAIPLLGLRGNSSAQQPNAEPPVRVPSNVAWTRETFALVSSGDPFRGLLLARLCNHCHGEEGFSAVPELPNLAGEDRLSFWKQMRDPKDAGFGRQRWWWADRASERSKCLRMLPGLDRSDRCRLAENTGRVRKVARCCRSGVSDESAGKDACRRVLIPFTAQAQGPGIMGWDVLPLMRTSQNG